MSHMIVPDRRVQNVGVIDRPSRGLSAVVPDADRKALMEMDIDELVILGRMIHAGRIISSQTFGGVITTLASVIRAIDSTLLALRSFGVNPDESTVKAKATSQGAIEMSSKTGISLLNNGDKFLDAIASIIVARLPGSSVDYWDSTRTLHVVGAPYRSPGPESDAPAAAFSLSLQGAPDLSTAAGYIYGNKDVGQKFSDKAKAFSLNGVGLGSPLIVWGVIILGIIALAALIYGLWVSTQTMNQVERKRLREEIVNAQVKIALNNSKIKFNNDELAALAEGQATPESVARKRAILEENAVMEAENSGYEKKQALANQAIDDINKSGDVLERLGKVFESFLKYFLYGGAAVVLIGLALWIWKPF